MGTIASRLLSSTEVTKQCKHIYRTDGHQCELMVYRLAPLKGYCEGHYARSVRGRDMDKPFKNRSGDVVRIVGTIRTRQEIADAIVQEAMPYSLYKKVNEIIALRFDGFEQRNWRPVNEYKTIDFGHMQDLTSVQLPTELATTIKEYAKDTNRTAGLLIQDILEEWYADLVASRKPKLDKRTR